MPGLLQVAAVRPAGGQGRDRGHHLGQGAVGADLVPHRRRDRLHQLELGVVGRAVAGAQLLQVQRPFGLVLFGQDAEGAGAQAVAPGVHEERALPSGVLGPRLATPARSGGRAGAPAFEAGAGVGAAVAMVMAGGPAGKGPGKDTSR